MKRIEAYVRINKLEDVKAALEEAVRIRMAERDPRRLLRWQPGFRQRRP